MNRKALAKARVAVFMPQGRAPDTPVVYAFAETDSDYRANAALLPAILGCGFGMVCIDTPLTGICRFGSDMARGRAVNITGDFNAAVQTFAKKFGASSLDAAFYYHTQRFTARNLWLTQKFLEDKLGIKPRTTVLSGTGSGTLVCAFAFGATGFGDILLGVDGQPGLLASLNSCRECVQGQEPSESGSVTPENCAGPKPVPPFNGFADKNAWLRLSLAAKPGGRKLWLADPLRHAELIGSPREIHLLCGGQDAACPVNGTTDAITRYRSLQWPADPGELLTHGNRDRWDSLLAARLNSGKSVSWFDGGHGLDGWRGDLRLKFLETKLRMLN